MNIIETERLILRTWKDEDAAAYFAINQDPKVIEFLPWTLSIDETKNFITRMNEQFVKSKYTLWAVEEKTSNKLIGFIGLNQPTWSANFTPCIEIGWRLASEYWNKGYATEGAKSVLQYGFEKLGLKEIVAFTVPDNIRSIRVMEKIGMKRDLKGDFAHPRIPKDNKCSCHILYRIITNS